MSTYTVTRSTTSMLARLAGVSDPDTVRASSYDFGDEQTTPESPGATWLHAVEGALVEAVECDDDLDPEDGTAIYEIADGAVEVYTHRRWQVFTDLAMWQVDISDFASGDQDMTTLAGYSQYEAARTLVAALLDEWSDQ